jgi:uncharacterized repeat protein (TIGR01451 family)
VELLEISGSGILFGQLILDLDGNGFASGADTIIAEAPVVLTAAGSSDVIDEVSTDENGAFIFEDVPVGSYTLTVGSALLSDTLEVLETDEAVFVGVNDTLRANVLASFPHLTLAEALAATPGLRVFTGGIALNSRVNPDRDGQVHFKLGAEFLRALNVERSAIQAGDSVRLLGRMVSDNGRPALVDVTPFVQVQFAAVVSAEEATLAETRNADGGRLDAALVKVRDVEITDTMTTAEGHFRFMAHDRVDTTEVLIRDFLNLPTTQIRPDTTAYITSLTGLLSPVDDGAGSIRWRILPRASTDIAVPTTKRADVSVSMELDTAAASLGDTVQVTVIVANAGPRPATGLEITDTVPAAVARLDHDPPTSGSYDLAAGLWTIDELAENGADTLRIRLEVTDGTPANVSIIARFLGLVFEVDPDTGDHRVERSLGIS